MSIAKLPFHERLRIGKQGEAQMLKNLQAKGYFIKPATLDQDKHDKIDGWLSNDGQNFIPFQSKYRETGTDIGMDVFEPFFGVDNPNTRQGRDYRGKAQLYVTQVHDQLYVMARIGLHRIVTETISEWRSLGFKYDFGDGLSRGTFNSRQYPGVQLKLKIDEENCNPKIMAYIPPAIVNDQLRRVFTVSPIRIDAVQGDSTSPNR